MATIPRSTWKKVRDLYLSGRSMRQVANELTTSLGSVVYVLRSLEVPRRSSSQSNSLVYSKKPASFSVHRARTENQRRIELTGALLYWAEGYKAQAAQSVDFANSDVEMAQLFMDFLRSRYTLDERRLRPFIYCYANQDARALTRFWSEKLKIPSSQFTKPYVRKDFRKENHRMTKGLIHIRYSDTKLLRDILDLIESIRRNRARRW